MYDEHNLVNDNIEAISELYPRSRHYISHSFDKVSPQLLSIISKGVYICHDNLATKFQDDEVATRSMCRNLETAFTKLYNLETGSETRADLIVALTGDTKIYDASFISRCWKAIEESNLDLLVCQAKGQYFWTDHRILSRLQTEHVHDFEPCLFLVKGSFGFSKRVFSSIPVSNRFTVEQCLGDAYLANVSDIRYGRLNPDPRNWMSFSDGVKFQYLTNGKAGRAGRG